jgi:hypothetical protein
MLRIDSIKRWRRADSTPLLVAIRTKEHLMEPRGWTLAALGIAALGVLAPAPAGAETTEPAPDPEVVAIREAAVAGRPPVETDPAEVLLEDGSASAARAQDLYYLRETSTSGGFVQVAARDNPAQDSPGYLTTTMRIYGNAAAFRSDAGPIALKSQFTCSGAGISGLTIGSGGASVSGGVTSSTLTWNSSRSSYAEVRQFYSEGGHFRCKASNASPAKTTRRATATAEYKQNDVRAEDSYSFWW